MQVRHSQADASIISPADLCTEERAVVRWYHTRRLGWKRFGRTVRRSENPLLQRLSYYQDCVLVAGCQRSGTTMLTRIIANAQGFARFDFTHDDELDAALILAGRANVPIDRRYCFQTTYLNERYSEYRLLGAGQRLIWVLRNPYSVIYSMVYNWRRFALEELYASCGEGPDGTESPGRAAPFWSFGPSRMEKACQAYRCKTAQIFKIRELVPADRLLIVDYDALVLAPEEWLPRIFAFIGEPYDVRYGATVRPDSLGKSRRLSPAEHEMVDRLALPTYQRCSELIGDAPLSRTGSG